MLKIIILAALLVSIFAGNAYCGCWTNPLRFPIEYTFMDTQGTVIDGETKKPMEGVIVVGMWKIEGHWPFYLNFTTGQKLVFIEETLTDNNGEYRLPAPPPLKRPYPWFFKTDDPEILFFKPGYRPEWLNNYFFISSNVSCEVEKDYYYSTVRKSFFDGKTVDLYPYRIGQKVPFIERYDPLNNPNKITGYEDATMQGWGYYLYGINTVFRMMDEGELTEINGISINIVCHFEPAQVKNLLRAFYSEYKNNKDVSFGFLKQFEDYAAKEVIKNEK